MVHECMFKFECIFSSDGVRSRTRTRSEAETLSSTSLLITLEGKKGVNARLLNNI